MIKKLGMLEGLLLKKIQDSNKTQKDAIDELYQSN